MNNARFREILAWLVSITVFGLLTAFFSAALDSLGLETYIDYGREICDRNDICRDGSASGEMMNFGVLSFLLALGAFNCVVNLQFPPFRTPVGNLTFNVWLVGSVIVSFLGVFISQIFDDFAGWLNLAILVLVAYLCYQYYEDRMSKIYGDGSDDQS